MAGLACGLSLEGYKVFTYSIANFTTLRCLEQIRNDICYHNANVTSVSVGGGFSYGQLGVSHFATEDLAILRSLPNMRVIVPSDPWEVKLLTKELIKETGPKYLRLDKGEAGLPKDELSVSLGKGKVVREGDDLTLIATGAILSEAISAAGLLSNEGIETRVVAIHSIKPMDEEIVINAAKETGGIICIEEHVKIGGLSGSVSEILVESNINLPIFLRVGIDDEFPSIVGDQNYLRKEYQMDSHSIFNKALKAIKDRQNNT